MTLKARLIIVVTVIIVTLTIAVFVIVSTQRRYLTGEVDRRLRDASPVAFRIPPSSNVTLPDRVDRPDGLPEPEETPSLSELYIAEISADGDVVELIVGSLLDDRPAISTSLVAGVDDETIATVSGRRTDARFRVRVVARGDQRWGVIALPLDDAESAVNRLLVTMVVAAGVIVAVVGLGAWWVVRLGLRPIARVTTVADAIAAGSRDQRVLVRDAEVRTEAGRLGTAINVMLDERDAAETNLRRFVADASHELRTPLTSISGYLELYADGAFRATPDIDDVVRRMRGEVTRMTDLVEDLLLLASFDQGRAIAHDPVDVADILVDAAADARAVQPGRTMTVDVPDASLHIEGDDARLRQVVAALVHNALVHTSEDVTVRLAARDRGNGLVELSVTDDGPGLTADEAALVFERFVRGDHSRSRHTGGSGLGLPIAQSIIAAHNGTLTLDTEPGAGCTFRIMLPANRNDS